MAVYIAELINITYPKLLSVTYRRRKRKKESKLIKNNIEKKNLTTATLYYNIEYVEKLFFYNLAFPSFRHIHNHLES